MAKSTGVDSDQGKAKRKAPIDRKKAALTPWVMAKKTLEFPKTLAADFKAECESRRLSERGVIRDLMICWILANKAGVDSTAYRKLIEDEVTTAKIQADEAAKKSRSKTTSREKLEINKAKREDVQKVKGDSDLHKENPFDDWEPL